MWKPFEVSSGQRVFGRLEQLTYSQLGSCSHKDPHLQHPPPPPAFRPRKRFIVQAGSNASEDWFWLVHCTASETLTFLQGLHLELVSCAGTTRLGRSLARLCDWTRLSLYGLQDCWSCQTVICQSLADIFKPEHKQERANDWCKGLSKMPVMFQLSTNSLTGKRCISQCPESIWRTKTISIFLSKVSFS